MNYFQIYLSQLLMLVDFWHWGGIWRRKLNFYKCALGMTYIGVDLAKLPEPHFLSAGCWKSIRRRKIGALTDAEKEGFSHLRAEEPGNIAGSSAGHNTDRQSAWRRSFLPVCDVLQNIYIILHDAIKNNTSHFVRGCPNTFQNPKQNWYW
jgi:hypothetical protein